MRRILSDAERRERRKQTNHRYYLKVRAAYLAKKKAQTMPKILDDAVTRIKARGVKASSAYPIAVSALQKAGDLKRGSLKATQKGAKRGAMTQSEREKTR